MRDADVAVGALAIPIGGRALSNPKTVRGATRSPLTPKLGLSLVTDEVRDERPHPPARPASSAPPPASMAMRGSVIALRHSGLRLSVLPNRAKEMTPRTTWVVP